MLKALLSAAVLLVTSGVVIAGEMQSFDAVKVRGELTQGALLIGETAPGNQVALDGKALDVDSQGRFVLGFGRDAKLQHQLTVTRANGDVISNTLTLTPREYRIERVDGVPQRTVTPDPKQVARARKEAGWVWQARQQVLPREDFLTPIVAPAKGRISGYYGSQRVLNGDPKRPHYGQDVAAPEGSTVVAPWSGEVTFANDDLFYSGGTIIIAHGHGVNTTYLHLSEVSVKVGQTVEQGQPIGKVGATGRATGPHLDWRVNWGQVRLDPALLPKLYP